MKMSSKIITVPNKTLFEVTKPVTSFNDELKDQVKLMTEILQKENGVGLAANQIGFDNSVLITEFNDPESKDNFPLHILINPELVELSPETGVLIEGCLSVPQVELPITRSKKIKIKAQDLTGKKVKLTAKGLLARVIQHETDHLNGIIFTQKAKAELKAKNPSYRNLKIVFIGSGSFAEPILKTLILLDFNIIKIITEASKEAGRNKEMVSTPVACLGNVFEKDVIETSDIKKDFDVIKNLKADIIVLTDFGQIIPQEILDIPKLGAINIHPSLLPKYRGSTPIQNVILSGELKTGVSIIKMVQKVDAGPILAQEEMDIFDFDNSLSLKERLSMLGMQMIVKLLPQIQSGKVKALEQNHTEATHTKKLSKEHGLIDWNESVQKIDRQIRALFPWPGSYTELDGKRLIIHQAHLENNKLFLDIVQAEGKKPMTFTDFLRGYKGPKPKWFSKLTGLEKK